jgi:hypothetical protein
VSTFATTRVMRGTWDNNAGRATGCAISIKERKADCLASLLPAYILHNSHCPERRCCSLPLPAGITDTTCFASCSSRCCFTQYNATSKQCNTCSNSCQTTTNAAANYRIHYKDRFNSNTDANGARVCRVINNNGWWKDCNLGPTILSAYTSGPALSGADATTVVLVVDSATWHPVSNVNDCKNRCGESSVCWGFVYQTVSSGSDRCLYMGGQGQCPSGPIPSVFNTYVV